MKREKIIATIASCVFCGVIAFSMSGCGGYSKQTTKVSAEKQKMEMTHAKASLSKEENVSKLLDFSASLLKSGYKKDNTLFSPFSAYLTLAMTANGAAEKTAQEMYSFLGMEQNQLNEFCGYLYGEYGEKEEYKQAIKIANSIWYKAGEDFTPQQDFLAKDAKYYGAEIFSSDFSNKTIEDVNWWVKEKTEGKIKNVLKEIPTEATMLLINSLLLKATWQEEWQHYSDLNFTDKDGKQSKQDAMSKSLSSYYESEKAKAFSYPLKNLPFSFLGILPEQSLDEYMKTLDGKELNTLLKNEKKGHYDKNKQKNYAYQVNASLPAFGYDYESDLTNILSEKMPTAFLKEQADFSNMVQKKKADQYWIGEVKQKTHIKVNKEGITAAAMSRIEMKGATANEPPTILDTINLSLNRPFLYVIYDTTYNIPLFIGTVTNL